MLRIKTIGNIWKLCLFYYIVHLPLKMSHFTKSIFPLQILNMFDTISFGAELQSTINN